MPVVIAVGNLKLGGKMSTVTRLAGLALFMLAVQSCNPTDNLTVTNGTTHTILIDVNNESAGGVRLGSGQTQTLSVREETEVFHVVAKTNDGEIVFDETFTEQQLEAMDWRILIEGG